MPIGSAKRREGAPSARNTGCSGARRPAVVADRAAEVTFFYTPLAVFLRTAGFHIMLACLQIHARHADDQSTEAPSRGSPAAGSRTWSRSTARPVVLEGADEEVEHRISSERPATTCSTQCQRTPKRVVEEQDEAGRDRRSSEDRARGCRAS